MTVAAPASPYKGLAPFGDSDLDALLFFGRERDREIVVANLIASRLTVLYGPSGVGKSSLLRAGVARALRELSEQPLVVVFSSWGEEPARALADELAEAAGIDASGSLGEVARRAASARGDVYLILDQAEEYFLYHGAEDPFAAELAAIVTEPVRVNVLLSVRDDALAKLDRFKARIPQILGNYLRLDRLDRAAGEAAIVRPVERFVALGGAPVEVEPALVGAVLDQVEAGRIQDGLGGVGGVEANGGTSGIEAPYLQLVMERLWEVERGAGSGALRAATLGELGGARRIVADHLERAVDGLTPEQQGHAAQLFRQLVTPSGTKIAYDVADLADYADAPTAAVRPVVDKLAAHRILRRDEGGRYEIYHDVLAGAVLAWRARYEEERAVERARAGARRRLRRLGFIFAGTLVALALMAAVTAYAVDQRNDARAQARKATARSLDADASLLLETDPELSVALALEAARLAPSERAEDVLRRSLMESRVRAIVRADGPLDFVEPTPDGRLFVSAGEDGVGRVARVETGEVVAKLPHGAPITALGVAADGKSTVTGGSDGVARLWSLPAGKPVREIGASSKPLRVVSYGPAGGLVLTAGDDGVARIWGPGPQAVAELRHGPGIRSAAFSADGSFVATAGGDSRVRLWLTRTGGSAGTLDQGGEVLSVTYDPQGSLLATTGANRTARLWHVGSWTLAGELEESKGQVLDAAFGPLGGTVAIGSSAGDGAVYRTGSGSLNGRLVHENRIVDVAFDPTGSRVATSSTDRTARVWASENGVLKAMLAGHGETVRAVRFVPGDRYVVTAGDDGTARVWEVDARPQLRKAGRPGPEAPGLTATSADGSVTARASGPVVVLDEPGGRRELRGHRDDVTSVAFSPDGTQLVTASRDHDAIVWDIASGERLPALRMHGGTVADARFSPDGRWVVTAGPVKAGIWSAATGSFVGFLDGPTELLRAAAFTPDSRAVVTVERDGTVRRAPCEACAPLGELMRLADARLAATGRRLTDDQRRRYLDE
jgi:WD40 repeat protein